MDLEPKQTYKIFAPRVTVLVTTADKDGNINAAPFSFAMPVSVDPPLIAFSSAPQRHTLQNIRETGEFVVNIPLQEMLNKLWRCSASHPKGVNELEKVGLGEEQSQKVRPPGVKDSAASIECKLEFIKEAGDHLMVVGRVVHTVVKRDILKGNGNLDIEKAKIPLHLGGAEFAVADRLLTV